MLVKNKDMPAFPQRMTGGDRGLSKYEYIVLKLCQSQISVGTLDNLKLDWIKTLARIILDER